jgi:Fe-S cluster biogenesis protein NfuA
MDSAARIEAILHRLRPLLRADGGDIELIAVTGNNATVRLSGKCAGCPSSHLTLHLGMEMAIRDDLPDFGELIIASS